MFVLGVALAFPVASLFSKPFLRRKSWHSFVLQRIWPAHVIKARLSFKSNLTKPRQPRGHIPLYHGLGSRFEVLLKLVAARSPENGAHLNSSSSAKSQPKMKWRATNLGWAILGHSHQALTQGLAQCLPRVWKWSCTINASKPQNHLTFMPTFSCYK